MKKSIAIFITIAVLVLSLGSPVMAQEQGQPGGGQGFFGMFVSFFSHLFNQNGQGQQAENSNGTPSGQLTGTPITGMPQGADADRLQGLVNAGKITSAQEQQILAEISKIQSEIQTWSQSTGIDAGYVYGGLRGQGMSAGIGQGQGQNGQQVNPGFKGGLRGGQLPNGGGPMGPR